MSRYNTPLRYPGGKQRLTPFIMEVLEENGLGGGHYAEPYAGGAGVGVELLLRSQASHIHLNDICPCIVAFWRSVIEEPDAFCRKVSGASMTIREWRRQREILQRQEEFNRLDVGFSLFFLNRCNRSGIARGGVIGGLRQSGRWRMDARFSRNELIRRIEAIASKASAISVSNMDAERFLLEYIPTLPARSLVYCDPPYFHRSHRLYLNEYRPEDHVSLARVIQNQVKIPWLVSYDSAPEIEALYRRQRSLTYSIRYSANRPYRGTEVFFFGKKLRLPARSKLPSIDRALLEL